MAFSYRLDGTSSKGVTKIIVTDKYSAQDDSQHEPFRRSNANPANWSRRTWMIVGIVSAILVVIAIAVGVVEIRKDSDNAYPEYTNLTYTLADTYSGSSFFDNFDYWSAADPADGFAVYVDEPGAVYLNLTSATEDSAVLKVDTSTTVDASRGRRSVRITSKKTYNNGLFIFDVLHTPYGCGTWPALWLSDPYHWPNHGEIDVVEAVNTGATGSSMTLHTSKGCSMSVERKETGTAGNKNCWSGTDSNAGCGVRGNDSTYGDVFNNNGGGVYAVEWRSAGIRVWWWPRDAIASDIDTSISDTTNSTTTPDPGTWGEALADFPNTKCDIDTHFRNASIIANIDFCGGWAGSTNWFNTIAGCPGTCDQYVQNNGSAFEQAYWEIRSIRVYTAS